MAGLSERRFRFTLMGLETTQGAGGRMIETTPVIAEVWGSLSSDILNLSSRQDRQFLGQQVAFMTAYSAPYMATKSIRFAGKTYLVDRVSRTFDLQPTIEFEAKEKSQ